MEKLKSLEAVLNQAIELKTQRLVVGAAQDLEVLEAVVAAKQKGMAELILIGDVQLIRSLANEHNLDLSGASIFHESDGYKATREAVAMIKRGEADMLMKGLVNTDIFMKAILDKEIGLRTGRLLTHVSVFEVPAYHQLLILSDVAINIAPDLMQKLEITQNAIDVAHALGNELPKVAVLSATEKVNAAKMPSSGDAALLSKMSDRGQIKGALVDGPLAFDNAISLESARIKKIESPVAGDADILIFPNIESGNVIYKALNLFAQAKVGAIVMGLAKPVVLTSRADSAESKLYSIALAALLAQRK